MHDCALAHNRNEHLKVTTKAGKTAGLGKVQNDVWEHKRQMGKVFLHKICA